MKPAFSFYLTPTIIEPQRATIILPAFSLPVPTWAGASGILAQYHLVNSTEFSLKLPINSFGEHFIAAIRWMDEDDIFVRFLLFAHPDAVLYYPLYNGERIGANAVIEIWSVDSTSFPTLFDDYTFYSSTLIFPPAELGTWNNYCANNNQVTILVQTPPSTLPPGDPCNPFCGPLCNTEPPMPVCECPIVVKANVADARAYTPDVFLPNTILVTEGGVTPGDSYGKAWRWDSTSMAADDGTPYTTVILPNNINGAAPGRWLQTSLG